MTKSYKNSRKNKAKLGIINKSNISAHPSQRGIMSLVIIFFIALSAFLWVMDHKKLVKLSSDSLDIIQHLVIGPEAGLGAILIVLISLLCWVKDKFTLLLIKEKQHRLAKLSTQYNERFNEIQSAMIAHYSLYDQEAVTAINEARALLGTLIQRLINVGLFLGGSKRIHIYDAYDQVTQPLEFGENSISVLLTSEPFRTTPINELEERLEELLEIGERPLEKLDELADEEDPVTKKIAA